jgi:hypothetical protein
VVLMENVRDGDGEKGGGEKERKITRRSWK